jgi:uncharacterized membrane protein
MKLACRPVLVASLILAALPAQPGFAHGRGERMPAHEREMLRHELRRQAPGQEPAPQQQLSPEERQELRRQLRERHRQMHHGHQDSMRRRQDEQSR